MRGMLIGLAMLCGSLESAAQETALETALTDWARRTGVVVTRGARDELAWTIGAEAYRTAAGPTAPGPPPDVGSSEKSAVIALADSLEASKRPRFYESLTRLVAFPALDLRLKRFPNVRVVVQPAPPRDYAVQINGETYPATEQGLYGVAAGPVSVSVSRRPKPPCTWQGWLQEAQEHTLTCQF